MLPSQPIGIFDSGVGGLTVAAGIARHLPNEQIIYFGDTAHMPYGEKSEAAIKQYSLKITDFLLTHQCKIIVIACNTASAAAYEVLKHYIDSRVLLVNVIDPIVEAVVHSPIQKLGIIATRRTNQSAMYPTKLKALKPNLHIHAKTTSSLASMIEEGMFRNEKTINAIIEYYLSDPPFQNIDGLVLACTHYPIIRHNIRQFFEKNRPATSSPITILDSTDTVALKVKKLLTAHHLLNVTPRKNHHFYVSDYTDGFEKAATIFFPQKVKLTHYPIT